MQSLHRSIPDSKIPLPLKRPLVFGDREQIEALNDMEADIEIMESDQAKISSSGLKYFDVCIAYSGEQFIKVLAVDRADAEKKARNVANQDEADVEIDYVNAREIKGSENA